MRVQAASGQEGEIEKYSKTGARELKARVGTMPSWSEQPSVTEQQREVGADVPEDVTTAQGPEDVGAYLEQKTSLW